MSSALNSNKRLVLRTSVIPIENECVPASCRQLQEKVRVKACFNFENVKSLEKYKRNHRT